MTSNLVSVDYEVYGQVQGTDYKNTVETATKQGCVGWVRNTHRGTVEGVVQGPKDKINFMKHWLQNVGSPFSTIEKCEFKNERNISSVEFQRFFVK
ncbi:hypothetical protein LOTGIDRAFT_139442 [Lottia gigantea]|uniref:acylphosphatase n=1 Tax=Lottia gigantea TaxID=225164 RepID=V4B676_LOTGI|nr:hypothetical protein LOTGIDRAFT_139442 [Lottia gigantea]ESP01602.1 hypothetical protein LOTGIDRAFT_139442 [Lottia gigantea]